MYRERDALPKVAQEDETGTLDLLTLERETTVVAADREALDVLEEIHSTLMRRNLNSDPIADEVLWEGLDGPIRAARGVEVERPTAAFGLACSWEQRRRCM